VFCPEYRGCGESEGEAEWAAGEVRDVLAAIEYLGTCGLTDGRIGLYGVSHGAAVSVLAAGRNPEIDAVVAESGFYDMRGFYDHFVMAREEFIRACGGTPEQVPGEYDRRSALNYVDDIDCPVLITHGKQDMVVPYQQAVDMHEALVTAGNPAALLLFEDGGHWISDPERERRAGYMEMVVWWLAAYLG
jgi:dipeptidyl aminopeptidase/acylaminoacyl peptidase